MFRGNVELISAIILLLLALWNLKVALIMALAIIIFLGIFKKVKRRGLKDQIRAEDLNKIRKSRIHNKNMEEIFNYILKKGAASNDEIEEKLNFTDEEAAHYLNTLESKGRIERVYTTEDSFAYRVKRFPTPPQPEY